MLPKENIMQRSSLFARIENIDIDIAIERYRQIWTGMLNADSGIVSHPIYYYY